MDIKTLCDKYSLNRIVLLVYFYVLVLDEPLDQMVYLFDLFVCLMMFNTTFNNISVISWRSVLLVEETGGPGENVIGLK